MPTRRLLVLVVLFATVLMLPATLNAVVIPIGQVQGATHTSPFSGQIVEVEGIVTVRRSNQFFLQSQQPDADPATSEALVVFTGSPPAVTVGDLVRVSGRVSEFRPGGAASTNLSQTQLGSPLTITVLSSGHGLPAPTVIGLGGRTPPTEVIEDDATGSVETSGVFDPATDGIDFYETLEHMRTQVNDAVVVGPRNNFGEILVLADGGAGAGVRTARGGIVIRHSDFNPERIMLDDLLMATPPVDVADRFTTSAVGVMTYDFGNFKIAITSALTPVGGGLARETAAAPKSNELSVGTFNVENLSPADPASKFAELADIVVEHLRYPDVIAVEEVQDNNGVVNDSVVDASATWNIFIVAIEAAGGPTYQYRQIDPVDDADGGVPGGNIRVGFLFRTDRGLRFIDRPGAGSMTPNDVVATRNGATLKYSPGRVDPANPAWSTPEGVRKPLAGEFQWRGRTIIMIANHWKSKSGDQPLFGRFQPPTLTTEPQRVQEAQSVKAFVDKILAVERDANVIVLGDLNDFEFSNSLTALEDGRTLNTLVESLPQTERYSYVFEGNSQTLDHIVVSSNLYRPNRLEYDIVHVNSEFAAQASDHEPQVAHFKPKGGRDDHPDDD